MPSNIEAQGVANAISQERVSQTVSFPRTGDAETDCMIGFIRVAEQIGIRSEILPRIFKYLLERYQWAENRDKQDGQGHSLQELMKQIQMEQDRKKEWHSNPKPGPTFGDPLWPGYNPNTTIPEIGTICGPTCDTGPGSGLANPGKTLCEVFEIESKEKLRKK